MSSKIFKFLSLSFLFLSANCAHACTDFLLKAQDSSILITRTLEFALDLHSNLRSSNRNRQYSFTAPNGKASMSWKAKYGYLFVDGLHQDFTVDGMNEKGLSFEFLYLPGETQYQTIPQGKENQAIPYLAFGDWVLSQFQSVDEVRNALANIYVYQQTFSGMGNMVFPLHAAMFDSTGKGIVVEFTQGQMHVYDNIGVMTNSPTYDWQVTNLNNYVNLSPYNPKPIIVDGVTYNSTGQGGGMLGLPGNIAPPARFVKIATLLKVSYPVKNAVDELNLAQHIINNVDIPSGLARSMNNGKEESETTQWTVFKDLTHKIFYYRTYNDMTVRQVSFDKIDFSANAPRLKMPLAQPTAYVMNMTDQFLQAK